MYQYRRILSLISILALGLFLSYFLIEYLMPVFLGFTFAYLLFPCYKYLNKKINQPKTSATIVLILFVISIIIMISLIASSVFSQFSLSSIETGGYMETLEQEINSLFGFNITISEGFESLKNMLTNNLREYSNTIISFTISFMISLFIFFFMLFYGLVQHDYFLKLAYKYLPFSKKSSQEIVTQSGCAIKALLLGQILTAVIQGVLGMISFLIVGIEGAIFWGIIMIIFSFIPIVGAFIIWLPFSIILFIEGSVGQSIFIFLWGSIVVSQVDNIIRPLLVTRFFKIHPILIILGVFGGLSMFGMGGIVLGPLLLALFVLLVQAFEKDYVSHN